LDGGQKGRIWIVDVELSFVGRRVIDSLEDKDGAFDDKITWEPSIYQKRSEHITTIGSSLTCHEKWGTKNINHQPNRTQRLDLDH
jgi:hypothetical protein